MYVTKDLCSTIREAVVLLEESLCAAGTLGPDSNDLKAVLETAQLFECVTNKIVSTYSDSKIWAKDGYLSAKTAIVHESGLSKKHVEISLAKGKFLKQFPQAMQALSSNSITSDHIDPMVVLSSDRYIEFFNDDIEQLIDTGMNLNAQQYSYVVKHWKNMVDALIDDEPSDEYVAFEKRKLFLHELYDKSWFIHGELDPVTGKLLSKTLEAITQKLYDNTSPESRYDYTPAQQRADAIGYLAQNYTTDKTVSSTALLNTDIIIDLNDLNPETTTKQYLAKCITSDMPIIKTHSKKYLEQILCDTIIQTPIINKDQTINLGRKIRTATPAMKKQLMLKNETCIVPGCITPSKWCDAHHINHWLHGGPTNIENLALLCRRHHSMAHNNKTFQQKLAKWLHQQTQAQPPPTLKSS